MERQDYSFQETYEFSVEIDALESHNGEGETISGEVTFSADAVWNELDEEYECQFLNWSETSGRFNTIGEAPGREDDFLEDFRNYLMSQGVDSDEIGW